MVSKNKDSALGPVFIHSLFRSGSTYLFQVFRRVGERYHCYQEPLHELTLFAGHDRDRLLDDHGNELVEKLRHPKLDRPYYAELYEVSDQCLSLLNKQDIYDAYFVASGRDFGIDFWKGLVAESRGRPVIQECRTSSRIGAIKRELSGFHVYLWRNPWDQWWSYKVMNYFDMVSQLIINSEEHPEVVDRLRSEIGFEPFASDDINAQFDWFAQRPLLPEQSFLVFYVLWFLGLQEGRAHADLLLNIDRLSDSLEFRREVIGTLERNGVGGLDFSDCVVPQAIYGAGDREFFSRIEDKAHGLLLLSGVPQRSIDEVIAMRKAFEPRVWCDNGANASIPDLIRDAERARALARRFNSSEVEQCIRHKEFYVAQQELYSIAETRLAKAEVVAKQAEAHAQDAESRAQQAEAHAQDAESRAQQAETHAQDAESRAQQAEAHAQDAESRAQQAQARAQDAESRAQQAEAHAQDAESRGQQAEANVQRLECQLNETVQEVNEWHERVVQLSESTSWRVTRPLRVVRRLIKGDPLTRNKIRSKLVSPVKLLLKPAVLGAMNFVLARPALKARVARTLRTRYPKFHARLRAIKEAQASHSLAEVSRFGGVAANEGPYFGKKVAILAPGSSSGTMGGAERFYSGLLKALQEKGCQAELVCIKVDESNFDGIQKGYKDFAELDLMDFDLVISTKAPTYVVSHPNHVLYLVHTVRVFYDMFDDVFPQADSLLREQQNWIHEHDKAAFSRIRHRFSIGSEVSRRLIEWNGCDAEVLHPPLDVEGMYDLGVGDYFYMPGRLHAWKRVDLAIRAIKCSSLPMRLVISGVGEAELELRELAGGDPRIEFLGRVDDETLKRLYAEALAVPFLPIREDYGYVTLEAFASGKPVITCVDSGEPTVFVDNGISGLVAQPNPQAVCDAFEQLWNDRKLASRMGAAGRERIAGITWDSVARRLLQAGFPDMAAPAMFEKSPVKVAILDMQPIIPAVGGGRLRLLGLYHGLGSDIQARYIGTYDWPGEKYRRHFITPTLEEIDVPLSHEHHKAAADAACKAGGKTVIDMLFAQQAHLSSRYLGEAFEAVKWADVVVFSHPWVAPLISDELLAGKTVIYDSHNIEAALREQLLDASQPFERAILDEVARAEQSAGDRADLILACSREDADGFVSRYGWKRSQIRVVPNGVFSSVILPATIDQKAEARVRLGIQEDAFVGFFIGSDYAPNIEAANFIIENLARELPDVTFAVGGGVCSRLPLGLPANVLTIGFLEEQDKVRWLQASDFAINPMFSGSGTNIKMFDFMSAGLPVVSTAIGARGIALESSAGLHIAGREELAGVLHQFSQMRKSALIGGQDNRRLVEAKYAWESISPELGRTIRSVHFRKQGRALLASPEAASRFRVAHLSTVGLKCGIGEYTRKIIDIYQQHGVSNFLLAGRAANEEPNLSGMRIPFEVSWFFDNVEWQRSSIQPQALQRMQDMRVTHLIVQYHPGFFSFERLLDFVSQAKELGIAVAVVVHNFIDEAATVMRRLNGLGVLLFSHRMTEVAQARALGVLLDQVPLGIEVGGGLRSRNIEQRDWKKQPPVIVTTGFLRKHKGVCTLIRAMPDVIKHYPGVKLVVQCALYPSADSEHELDSCRKEIERLGVQEVVTLDTRFLDKEIVFAALAKADIAVLPYEKSNEGGSATATDCMAVGLPLIVSDAEIFDEIRDVVLTAEPSYKHTADAILKVLSSPELYESLSSKSSAYARANSWDSVAGAFLVADFKANYEA